MVRRATPGREEGERGGLWVGVGCGCVGGVGGGGGGGGGCVCGWGMCPKIPTSDTVRPRTHSGLIPWAQKIEFESCK